MIDQHAFIVHEDGYAIRPKAAFLRQVVLAWVAGHYSSEFQSYRSSLEGIGDFPRARLTSMDVTIPKVDWQTRCAKLYRQRDQISEFIKNSGDKIGASIDDILSQGGHKRVKPAA